VRDEFPPRLERVVVDKVVDEKLFRRVPGGKLASGLKAGEVQNQAGILMLFENGIGLLPVRQIKLPPAKREKRKATPRQLLLKMMANESGSACDQDLHVRKFTKLNSTTGKAT
jgi:hypothetical protein